MESSLNALKKLNEPDVVMEICSHVAEGGSVIDLSKLWEIEYNVILKFLRGDPARKKAYAQAIEDRKEWAIERLLNELRSVSCVDMTQIFDGNQAIITVENWPNDVKQNLKKLTVKELFDNEGTKFGELKTVEFHDKLRAIDMYGKQLKMWADSSAAGSGASLADLLVMGRAMAKE